MIGKLFLLILAFIIIDMICHTFGAGGWMVRHY